MMSVFTMVHFYLINTRILCPVTLRDCDVLPVLQTKPLLIHQAVEVLQELVCHGIHVWLPQNK